MPGAASALPATATAILGAIQSADTLRRTEDTLCVAIVVLASKKRAHAEFPAAEVRPPVVLKCDAKESWR